jgi:DNA invertase Pin-like site-specific DNA recombinase
MKQEKPLEPPPGKRCAIYTRKSTSTGLEQAFNSLDAQREACVRYLQSQGQTNWQILPQQYDDGGFTGASLERPAFRQLMEDIADGLVDAVVVYKVDRLSRSLLDFAKVMETFNAKGIAFISVTQNFSTADAIGRLTLNMLMSFAEFEREMIAERTRDKISAARRKGKWTGGYIPMGYDIVDHRLVVNEAEAAIVRELFSSYLQERSALKLAAFLNDREVPLKNQRAPRTQPWTRDLVIRLLRNRMYLGLMHSKGQHYPGEQVALVDPLTFEKVQDLLGPRTRMHRPDSRNPVYLLRGLLRCSHCGAVMTTASTQRGDQVYRYYRCPSHGRRAQVCPGKQFPAEAIEEYVIEQLGIMVRQGCFPVPALSSRLAQMELEHGHLLEGLDKGKEAKPTTPEEVTRLVALGRSIAKLEHQIQEVSWLIQMLANFDRMWEVLPLRNRQRLVRALLEAVVVDEAGREARIRLANFEKELGGDVGIAS